MYTNTGGVWKRAATLLVGLVLLLMTGACDVQHPPANTEIILGMAIAME